MIKKCFSMFGKFLIIISMTLIAPICYLIDLWSVLSIFMSGSTACNILRIGSKPSLIDILQEYCWLFIISIFFIGFIICLICNYKSKSYYKLNDETKNNLSKFKNNLVLLFYIKVVWKYALKIIAIFYAIVAAIIFLYCGFRPDYAGHIAGGMIGTAIIGVGILCIYLGFRNKDE